MTLNRLATVTTWHEAGSTAILEPLAETSKEADSSPSSLRAREGKPGVAGAQMKPGTPERARWGEGKRRVLSENQTQRRERA